ncbi:hypothetical protein M8494_36320 [Serratia ureilytica]
MDEAHIVTVNPLLAPYMTKIVKMWRKLGAWLWLATQNLKDFPNIAEKMLNMAEWWVCLTMPPEEVNDIARFKALTEEQRRCYCQPASCPAVIPKAWCCRKTRGAVPCGTAELVSGAGDDRERREGRAPRADAGIWLQRARGGPQGGTKT